MCCELVQWLGRWTPGPGVLPAGFRAPDSERKIFMGCSSVSHQHEGDPKSAVLSLKYGGLLIKSAALRYQTPKGERKKKEEINDNLQTQLHVL